MSFYWATCTPVWTSDDVSTGIQRQSGQSYLDFVDEYVMCVL